MNIWNDAAWTSPEETADLMASFRKKHGENVAEPRCIICKKITSYIVEAREGYIQRGVGFLANLFDMRVLGDEKNLYFPVRMCTQCAAVNDAKAAAKNGGRAPDPKAMRGMTQPERRIYESTWNNVFRAVGGNAAPVEKVDRYGPIK